MRIGLFGGSFNPVHLGHVAIVTQLLDQGRLDRILVMPAAQNPLKADQPTLPVALRWQMLQAAFGGMPQVELRDDEIKRRAPSYTYQTLELLRSELPQDELFLLLGQDAYALFPHWARVDLILAHCRLILFRRRGAGAFSPDLQGGKVELAELEIPEISSTWIRDMHTQPALVRNYIPAQAFEIWRNHWEHFHEI